MEKIDFVVTWVDGGDPAWLSEFQRYKALESGCVGVAGADAGTDSGDPALDVAASRYRSWDNLQYWFRAVEKFAPWVNRIHFITWGHVPEWMNTSCPKLNIVKHSDFIPAEYLPTFSSHPIEMNMHRIEGLAEQFVYFNDDMFLTSPVISAKFFRNGLPCDEARLYPMGRWQGHHPHIILNNVQAVNRHYGKQDIKRHLGKWFNFRYSPGSLLRTATLMQWPFIVGFKDHHMPQSYNKNSFARAWELESALMDTTCRNRFRSTSDLSPWFMRYIAFMEGRFSPISLGDTRGFRLNEKSIAKVEKAIKARKYRLICLNDSDDIEDFETLRQRLNAAFDEILPEKSAYEI